MEYHDERLAEVLWDINLQKAVLRYDQEEMVASWLPADLIQARMREAEETVLAPLLEEAEEAHRLAIEERAHPDR